MKKIYNHSYPSLNNNDLRNVKELLQSRMIASGSQNQKLSSVFFKNKKVIPCGSANQALIIALRCLMECNKSNTILVSNYSCPSIFSVINFLNLKYEIVDIEKNYLISPKKVNDVLKKKNYLALVIPHIFGLKAKTYSFKKFKIPIIEDFAHTIPHNIKIYGDFAVFSFSATKTIAGGEGGILVINKNKYLGELNNLLFLKSKFNYSPFVMSDIQAKLILSQLQRKKIFISKRLKIARIYYEGLNKNYVKFSQSLNDYWNVFRLPIMINHEKISINKIITRLKAEGIIVRKPVSILLSDFIKGKKKFSNSEYIIRNTFSLPLYPALSLFDANFILKKTNMILKKISQ